MQKRFDQYDPFVPGCGDVAIYLRRYRYQPCAFGYQPKSLHRQIEEDLKNFTVVCILVVRSYALFVDYMKQANAVVSKKPASGKSAIVFIT